MPTPIEEMLAAPSPEATVDGQPAPEGGVQEEERPVSMEDDNLVPALLANPKGKEYLEKLAKRTIKNYKSDLDSGRGHREMEAKSMRLLLGMSSVLNSGPAEGSMKPCLPIYSKVVLRIYHKVRTMVLAADPVVVPTGDEDNARATRVSQYMSWERRAKHPEWQTCMEGTILAWVAFGDRIRCTSWDPVSGRKDTDDLSPRDCVVPYLDKDPSPNMSNVQRITRVMRMPRYRIEQLGDAGHYHEAESLFTEDDDNATMGSGQKIAKPFDPDEDDDPVEQIVREYQGVEPQQKGEKEPNSVYLFLQRHSWERLPRGIEGVTDDGKLHRIAFTIEKSTEKPLRLVIMEREDAIDKRRYINEERAANLKFQNMVSESQQTGLPPPVAPVPPDPVRVTPIHPFIHYRFLNNPEGFYGLGAYTLAGQLNEVANELMAENIAAERLANTIGGFMASDTEIAKGEIEVKYGKFIGVNVPRGELAGAFLPFPFQRPGGNIMDVIQRLDQEAQSNISAHDTLSGAPGPSRETAAAAKIRHQSAMASITSAMEGFLVPLSEEYKQYARLNATFLNETEYYFVTQIDPDTGGDRRDRLSVSRSDFDADFDVTFDADAKLELDPGLGQSAVQAYQMIMADPELAQNATLVMRARKKALRAMKCPELAALLPNDVPPPPPAPPPSPMSQEDENAGFFNEQDHPTLPDDDDTDHLGKMNRFEDDGIYNELSSTGKQLFDRHKRAHQGQAYQKAMRILGGGDEMGMGQGGPGGEAGLAPGPDNAGSAPLPFPPPGGGAGTGQG